MQVLETFVLTGINQKKDWVQCNATPAFCKYWGYTVTMIGESDGSGDPEYTLDVQLAISSLPENTWNAGHSVGYNTQAQVPPGGVWWEVDGNDGFTPPTPANLVRAVSGPNGWNLRGYTGILVTVLGTN